MNKDFNVMFLDDDGQLWYSKEFFDFQLKKKDIELDKFRPFTSAYEMKKEIEKQNNIFDELNRRFNQELENNQTFKEFEPDDTKPFYSRKWYSDVLNDFICMLVGDIDE